MNIEDKEQQDDKPCYFSHPPLKLISKGKEMQIYGGSSVEPIIKDADIYISIDEKAKQFEWEYPWNENPRESKNIRFYIEDFSLPSSFDEFSKMIGFLKKELLTTNKKIHVGCYGGHGRTGLVLAALAQELMGKENKDFNAIEYVRENYCSQAVETVPQILYLKHFFNTKEPYREKEELVEFNNFFKKLTGDSIKNLMSQGIGKDELMSYILDTDKELFYAKKYLNTSKQTTNSMKF